MTIEKQPFQRLSQEGELKRDIVNISLNDDERAMLEQIKRVLRENKDSTALKQMMIYGLKNLLHDDPTRYLLGLQFKNFRNARISGNLAELPKNKDL
jgi:hypothetical protein